jgi:Protein of unknown function (DUF3617)
MDEEPMRGVVLAGTGLIALALAAPALAERPDLKLGLWETTTVRSGGSPMDLSNMPPEARAKIEAYQKLHPNQSGPTHTVRSCLTKEKLDHEMFTPSEGPRDGCKRTQVKTTKTTEDITIECPNGAHGEGHFQILSPELSKGTFAMTGMSGPDGKTAFSMKSQMTSKWISADCGDVK